MTVSRPLPACVAAVLLTGLLAGCETTPPRTAPEGEKISWLPKLFKRPLDHPPIGHDLPVMPAAGTGRGGYYKDDGPGDMPPADLRNTPDAEVRDEPLARSGNKPYTVFGKQYTPIRDQQPFRQRGVGSWYGKKFHGQKTSSGEIYNMYRMTAAHPTLPIPSYARVTHAGTGKQIVVRINDRGPFHAGRIVDLSYTAALKIGLLGSGSHELIVERILPNTGDNLATVRRNAPDPAAEPARLASNVEITNLMLTNREEIKAVKALPEGGDGIAAGVAAAAEAPGLARQVQTAGPGFYVQMGVFSRAERAAEIRTSIAGQGWDDAVLDVVASGSLHKLIGGPFATRALAEEAARKVSGALGLRPIVVLR